MDILLGLILLIAILKIIDLKMKLYSAEQEIEDLTFNKHLEDEKEKSDIKN